MSKENIETFRLQVDVLRRGDVEAAVRIVHPDAIVEAQRTATEGSFIGHAGVRRFFADTAETFELFGPNYTDIRDLGDRVLAIGSIRLRGRGSGVEIETPSAAISE